MSAKAYHVFLVSWEQAGSHLAEVRHEVFVVEQAVPEALELDGRDPECAHALAVDGGGRAIGAARLMPEGRIGRVAVRREWRGSGVGAALMQALLDAADRRGDAVVELHAQSWTTGFYEKLGFAVEGDEFDEAGIPHRMMFRRRSVG